MTLTYSMQDWFFRIAFAPSCGGEENGPIAESHNVLLCSDIDVVINSKWAETASRNDVRMILMHECAHAIEKFLISRYGMPTRDDCNKEQS